MRQSPFGWHKNAHFSVEGRLGITLGRHTVVTFSVDVCEPQRTVICRLFPVTCGVELTSRLPLTGRASALIRRCGRCSSRSWTNGTRSSGACSRRSRTATSSTTSPCARTSKTWSALSVRVAHTDGRTGRAVQIA